MGNYPKEIQIVDNMYQILQTQEHLCSYQNNL